MKPLHIFAEKKDEKLSLAWLDENFQQTLNRCDELEARVQSLSGMVVDQAGIILELRAAISKIGNTESLADRVIALLKGKKK